MNKNSQHLRSVKTLWISGNGDELIIAQVWQLCNCHQLGQPYSRNVLERIKLLVDGYLNDQYMRSPSKEALHDGLQASEETQ